MGMFDDAPMVGQSGGGLFDDAPMAKPRKQNNEIPEMNVFERILAGTPMGLGQALNSPTVARMRGVVMGAADPVVGTVQLAANAIGQGSAVNRAIQTKEQEYEDERRGNNLTGFDGARLTGNIIAPANLAIATKLAPALTAAQRAVQGAGIGGAAGMIEPVKDGGENYWTEKAKQAAVGVGAGAVLAPALGAGLDIGGRVYNAIKARVGSGLPTSAQIDMQLLEALKESGQSFGQISPTQLAQLREQVQTAFKQGKTLNPAEALRRQDFQDLGMEPTLGAISRDSAQFSKEQNLRGLQGIGEPILERLNNNTTMLRNRLNAFTPDGVPDLYKTGSGAIDELSGLNRNMKAIQDEAFSKARNSEGRYANLNTKQFSEMANNALDGGNLGPYLPAQVRSQLNDVSSGKIPLNVNNMTQLDSVWAAAGRSVPQGSPEQLAINKVRDALKSTELIDGTPEALNLFAAAKGKTAEYYKLRGEIPALDAVAEKQAIPDNFVDKFIFGERSSDKVKRLAETIKQSNPELFAELRAQVAGKLQDAAFGANRAGGQGIAPERYTSKLNSIGIQKLDAFFSPTEVQELFRIGRVNSYINQAPANNTVNRSNTGSTLMNMLGAAPLIGRTVTYGVNKMGARNALKASFTDNPNLTPEQQNFLAMFMRGGAIAGAEAGQ